MSRSVFPRHRLQHLAAAALLAAGCSLAQAQSAPPASAPQSVTVRPEVAKPLQAAQEALKAGNGREALARVAEAEAVPGLTPAEAYMAQRLKAVAAYAAGDLPLALATFEQALASPLLPAADKPALLESSTRIAIQAKDMKRASALLLRYREAGGGNADLLALLPQLLWEAGDAPAAGREASAVVAADEKAGRASRENLLKVLAASQERNGDGAGQQATIEKLALQTGKPEYWGHLLAALGKPGRVGERLQLDLWRLRQATVGLADGEQSAYMAQLAMRAGWPAEARRVLDDAVAQGQRLVPEAQTLRQQATQAAAKDRAAQAAGESAARSAKDGEALVNLGFAMVTEGQAEAGAALMAQGVAKGGLKRPDESRLHLGIAQTRAGRAAEALASFEAVKGGDGSAELARLWALWVRAGAKK